MGNYLSIFIAAFFAQAFLSCSQANAQITEITELRDSLNAVNYVMRSVPSIKGKWTVVKVRKQKEWDEIVPTMKALLDDGHRNIEVVVMGNIVFGQESKVVQGWNYPDANIRVVAKKARILPYAKTIYWFDAGVLRVGNFYAFPYSEFSLDDIVVDSDGNEIPIQEDVKQIRGDILKVQGSKSSSNSNIWKFEIDLPDLTEEQCENFYVLITRDWTSARHRVVKVLDGWLYYQLDSEDMHNDSDPNVDWKQYRVRPRYRLINCPVSKGLHAVGGYIYFPSQYKMIRVNKGGQLITFAYCHLNSLEICGFTLNGCGRGTPFEIYSSTFEQGAFIRDNIFTNMSGLAISTAFNTNVTISNNSVTNTRVQAIAGGGTNTTICGNRLKNIGWMLNTRAITGGGEHLHICDNVIEDFNYVAIACGSTTSNEKAKPLTYIIERNLIRLTKSFTDNYIQNTLADGGGIYVGPQCKQGIIRYNVVENIKGIHSNRGIFLDDGAKNLAIYGNLIINTANSYDIDLRLCETYASDIPDHNTNNCMFDNILSGGYRFQGRGPGSNCFGGGNVLLGTGPMQKRVIDIHQMANDVQGNGISVENVEKVLPVDGFVTKQLMKK